MVYNAQESQILHSLGSDNGSKTQFNNKDTRLAYDCTIGSIIRIYGVSRHLHYQRQYVYLMYAFLAIFNCRPVDDAFRH